MIYVYGGCSASWTRKKQSGVCTMADMYMRFGETKTVEVDLIDGIAPEMI